MENSINDDEKNNKFFQDPTRMRLYSRILQLQKSFDKQNDCGGLCVAKTWGLASFGSFIATCVSFHPGDMVEYILPSKERSYIVFEDVDSDENMQGAIGFPWQEQKFETDQAVSRQIIMDTIFRLGTVNHVLKASIDYKILYAACCISILENKRLKFAAEIYQILQKELDIDLTPETTLLELLQESPPGSTVHIEGLKEVTSRRANTSLSSSRAQDLVELCSICDQAIPWDDLAEACCLSGHQFGMSSIVCDADRMAANLFTKCAVV